MALHEPEMSVARSDAIRDLLADRVREEPEFRRRRLRRRLLLWGGIGVVTLGGLSTAGSVIFGQAPVTDQSIVYCHSSIVPQSDGSLPGSGATLADDGGPGRVDDALELCTEMWRQGVFSQSFDPTAVSNTPLPEAEIPEMQVCVRGDGAAAVVPSDRKAICQSLGMAAFDR